MADTAGLWFALLAVILTISRAWSFTDGDLRLTGVGASPLLGRLEIYYKGTWGSVCGGYTPNFFSFSLQSAHTACGQMGLGFAVNFFSAVNDPDYRLQHGLGSGPIFLNNVKCSSNSHLLQCQTDSLGHVPPNCNHTLDVLLQCSNISSHYNGEIRLSPDPSTPLLERTASSGRVELYSNGQWKGVCLEGANSSTGDLLCRQLGYTEMDRIEYVSGQVITDVWQTNPSHLLCSPGDVCIASCLEELPHTTATTTCPAMTLSCKFISTNFYSNEVVGERSTCERQATPTPQGGVRLIDDVDMGRLEVFWSGVWGTVCGRHFTIKDADVVCTQLGFPTALRQGHVMEEKYYGEVMAGIGRIHTLGQCRGVEGHLTECSGTVNNNNICDNSTGDHLYDVALTCSMYNTPYGSVLLYGLKGQVTGSSGTLVMFTGSRFEAICDTDFEPEHAMVVCRQLGYSRGVALPNSYFGNDAERSEILRLTGSCAGSESQLLACPPSPGWSDSLGLQGFVRIKAGQSNECRPGIDEVAVQCVSDEIELRLVGGPSSSIGRLEVKYNGLWGRICGSGFSNDEALVACRSLGYFSALSVQVDGISSQVHSQPVHFSNMTCSGFEKSLLHCHFLLEATTPCTARDDSIWIECGSEPLPQDGMLRLVDGERNDTNQSGRLEVSYNNKWRSVCGRFFSDAAAEVACRDLGYTSVSDFCTDACFGESEEEVLFVEDKCEGSELHWQDCPIEIHHSNTCSHARDVGLICAGRIILPTTSFSSNPPPSVAIIDPAVPSLPSFAYYVIGGVGAATILLAVAVIFLICCYCSAKRRKKNRQGTWTNRSRSGNATQNGHTHHNVAVSDIPSKMAALKEEGFDDPKEALNELDMVSHSYSHYGTSLASSPVPLHRHHDMHALSHSQSHSQNSEEEQQGYPSDHSVNHHIQGTSHSNGEIIGNGVAVAMVHGIGTEQRPSIPSSNTHARSQIPFTCPLPNYNEIYRSSSAVTVSNSYVNSCLGNSSTAWYEDQGGNSESEDVKVEMKT